MQLKKFARNGAGEGDGGVSGWLETGCFDALDRQYLKTLVFGVYADAGLCSLCAVPLLLSRINPPPLPRSSHTPRSIESYEFKFEYPSSDHIVLSMAAAGGQTPGRAVSMRGGSSGNSNSSSSKDGGGGARSKKECVKAMMAMLRRVVVMTQALKPITGATFVSIKLYYHDDITPHDYEPPNFRKGLAHEHDAHDTSGMDSFELGEMQTPHHKIGLTVVAVADMSDNSDGSDEDTQLPEDSLERPESGQAANNGTELSQVSNLTGVMEVLQERLDGGSKHGRLEAAIQEFKIEAAADSPDAPAAPSGIDMPMLQCIRCKTLGHPPCFGYRDETDKRIPSSGHLCYVCANDTKKYSQEHYDLAAAANRALFRRSLDYVAKLGGILSILSFSELL
ncbi:HORMA domain-containing protein 1, partial [Entophlyctis luteolus]